MNEDERLQRLLSVSRPDAFWHGQKRRILRRIEGGFPRRAAWRLATAAAAASLVLVLQLRRRPAAPPAFVPPAHEWGLLENLDLLEDMDVIETLDVARKGS